MTPEAGPLQEGQRVGRFVLLRDMDGTLHAVAAGSVAALCQADEAVVILLPGGRMVRVEQPLETVLGWLTC